MASIIGSVRKKKKSTRKKRLRPIFGDKRNCMTHVNEVGDGMRVHVFVLVGIQSQSDFH